jgi:transcription termination factor Rho
VTAQALEQSVLESKDKGQLIAIADALGVKASARNKKSEIIDLILDKTGASRPVAEPPANNGNTAVTAGSAPPPPPTGLDEPKAEWEIDLPDDAVPAPARPRPAAPSPTPAVLDDDDDSDDDGDDHGDDHGDDDGDRQPDQQRHGGQSGQGGAAGQPGEEGESRNKRRRRRRKNRGGQADGQLGDDRDFGDDPVHASSPSPNQGQPHAAHGQQGQQGQHGHGEGGSSEPVEVEGYLDMRDEGYGFLRVDHYLPSKNDAYIPVKLSRQYGLRKGDHVVALSRPAGRNEKNPAVLEIISVNGRTPDDARRRPRFEDLTALFPDEKLKMETPSDPSNMTARIIDLVCPIGKGQRGIIVSPPKAGKTTVMKAIAASIEKNNPEVKLIVLLVDERPEEVTDMKRSIKGEVIASTFDKPSEQHTQIAEMAIEKAKRLVEYGEDVVVILDGITRLARAYNLAAPASGRILSGGIDAGALYPPKKFFGAARNVEEGGSLTILATALVETNSRMDEAVFEEFKGTGNMELRLDRRLAERRIYPAIDVDASSTRHEELLYDPKQLQMVWKLRRVLQGLAHDGNAAPGLELLVDRLRSFRNNDEFLNEISKQPGK